MEALKGHFESIGTRVRRPSVWFQQGHLPEWHLSSLDLFLSLQNEALNCVTLMALQS